MLYLKNHIFKISIILLLATQFKASYAMKKNELHSDSLESMLIEASSDGNLEAVKACVIYGADINTKEGFRHRTPLMLACNYVRENVIDYLLSKGALVNLRDEDGKTALMLNCLYYRANLGIVTTLIERGARINDRANNGKTALMYATSWEGKIVASYLISHGAKTNVKSKRGETLLMCACQGGDLELAKSLVIDGADINAKGGYLQWTPLMNACERKKKELVDYILSKGALINLKDKVGQNALMLICNHYRPSMKIIKKLIERGAHINEKNYEGKTALIYATKREENKEVGAYLKRLIKKEKAILQIEIAGDVKKKQKKLISFICDFKYENLMYAKQIALIRLIKCCQSQLTREIFRNIIFNETFLQDKKACEFARKYNVIDKNKNDIVAALIRYYTVLDLANRPDMEYLLLQKILRAQSPYAVEQLLTRYMRHTKQTRNKRLHRLLRNMLIVYKNLVSPKVCLFYKDFAANKQKEQERVTCKICKIRRCEKETKKKLEAEKVEKIEQITKKKKQGLKKTKLLAMVEKHKIKRNSKKRIKEVTTGHEEQLQQLTSTSKSQRRKASRRLRKNIETLQAQHITHMPHEIMLKIFEFSGLDTFGETEYIDGERLSWRS